MPLNRRSARRSSRCAHTAPRRDNPARPPTRRPGHPTRRPRPRCCSRTGICRGRSHLPRPRPGPHRTRTRRSRSAWRWRHRPPRERELPRRNPAPHPRSRPPGSTRRSGPRPLRPGGEQSRPLCRSGRRACRERRVSPDRRADAATSTLPNSVPALRAAAWRQAEPERQLRVWRRPARAPGRSRRAINFRLPADTDEPPPFGAARRRCGATARRPQGRKAHVVRPPCSALRSSRASKSPGRPGQRADRRRVPEGPVREGGQGGKRTRVCV